MLKLLDAFDRPEESSDLRKALEKEGKKPKEEKDAETEPLDITTTTEPDPSDDQENSGPVESAVSVKRTSARIKRRLTRASPVLSATSPTGLDALLQAMEAGPVKPDQGAEVEQSESGGPRGEKQRRIVLEQVGPVAAARAYLESEGVLMDSIPVTSWPSETPVDDNKAFVQFIPQSFLPALSFSPPGEWQERPQDSYQETPQPVSPHLPEESSVPTAPLLVHLPTHSLSYPTLSSMERYSPSGQPRPFQSSPPILSSTNGLNFTRTQTLVL